MKSKIKLATALLFLLAIILILALNSCKTTKSVSKFSNDSTNIVNKDSSRTIKNATTKTTKKDSTSKSEKIDSSSVVIEFDNEDSTSTGPVVIIQKGDSTIIDPGGRKIKSTKTKKSSSQKDSTNKSSTIDSKTNSFDSTNKKESRVTTVKKKSENVSVKRGRSFIEWVITLWWLWLLIIIFFIYRHVKKNSLLPFNPPF